MQPQKPTIRDLFGPAVVFRVPYYQRTYVWDEINQWDPLWFDVVALANQLVDATPEAASAQKPHFLGAAVLKETMRPGSAVKEQTVVDGQQRITTIQLLLAAVADTLQEFPALEGSEMLARNLTINSVMRKEVGDTPFKVDPLGRDFRSFDDVMRASKDGNQPIQVQGRIGDCYRFFLKKSSEWLTKDGESEGVLISRAEALCAAISDKLQVVAIYLDPGENEYAIFEALNARGEPLSEWEKVKNYILFKAGEDGHDQSEIYKTHLEFFDGSEWMKGIGRGAARRRKSDLFLDYWLESELLHDVNARYVFREFRSAIDSHNHNLVQWCQHMNQNGEYFLEWEGFSGLNGDVESLYHARRNALGIGAIWPFLMGLSRIQMQKSDQYRCFRALDSFMWRRAIVGISTRNYDAVTEYLLKALDKARRNPTGDHPYSDAVIEDLLDSQDTRAYLWPEDEEVAQSIRNNSFYMSGTLTRTILEAVERAMMRGHHPGNTNLSSKLPIEHLMPQTRNEEDWPIPQAEGDDEETLESRRIERRYSIQRLGNLTLVTHGLNSKLSNKPWVKKHQILHEEDNLYINKDLLNHAPQDHWDEEQIRLRGERLAGYILQIWPHGHAVTGEIEKIRPA